MCGELEKKLWFIFFWALHEIKFLFAHIVGDSFRRGGCSYKTKLLFSFISFEITLSHELFSPRNLTPVLQQNDKQRGNLCLMPLCQLLVFTLYT